MEQLKSPQISTESMRRRVVDRLIKEFDLVPRIHSYLFHGEMNVLSTSSGIELKHHVDQNNQMLIEIAVPIEAKGKHRNSLGLHARHAPNSYHMRRVVEVNLCETESAEISTFLVINAVLAFAEEQIAKAKFHVLEGVRYLSRYELETLMKDKTVSGSINSSAVIALSIGLIHQLIELALEKNYEFDDKAIFAIIQFVAFGVILGAGWGALKSNILTEENSGRSSKL